MGGAAHRPVTLNPARTLTPPAARTSASTADRMGLSGGEAAGDTTPQGDAGADIASRRRPFGPRPGHSGLGKCVNCVVVNLSRDSEIKRF